MYSDILVIGCNYKAFVFTFVYSAGSARTFNFHVYVVVASALAAIGLVSENAHAIPAHALYLRFSLMISFFNIGDKQSSCACGKHACVAANGPPAGCYLWHTAAR